MITRLDGSPATPEDLSALALYSYGHFTTLRVERSHVRGLDLHLQRLADDSRTLFDAELDTNAVRVALRHIARRHEAPVMVRVTVCAPEMSLDCPSTLCPIALISTRPAPTGDLPPLRLTTDTWVRDMPEVKHTGLFGTLRLRRDARRRGFDDTVLLDHHDHVQEGTTWNICFWDGSRLVWPRARCLTGVTTRLVREAATAAGVPVGEAPVTRRDLNTMRCAFATNTAFGIRPIGSIGEVTFAADPVITAAIPALYADVPADAL